MKRTFLSPLGMLCITQEDDAITALDFVQGTVCETGDTPLLRQAELQLTQYFTGARKAFSLPLAPRGTAFQQSVWQALQTIPYGQVCSYAFIARQLGKPQACRAVGAANGRNPIPIIIPCHRVMGGNGKLVGFSAGLDKKVLLLEVEGAKEPYQVVQ